MGEKTKTILLIIGLAISTIVIGVVLYFLFFGGRATQPVPTEPTEPGVTTPGSLPGAGEAGERPGTTLIEETPELTQADEVARGEETVTTALTTGNVENLNASSDGQGVNFLDPNDGRFYKIDSEGNIKRLSNQRFAGADNVVWSNKGEKAIIEFPDGSNVVYNFETQQQVTLPGHWEDFDFSPTSDRIISKSLGLDPENRWLIISDDQGGNTIPINALGYNEDKVMISWSPNDQVIAFAETADSLSGGVDRRFIVPVGKNDENFKGLVVEGFDFRPKWTPTGRQLLYSSSGHYSGNQPMLWIVDATASNMGENRRSLGVNTWADKCTFATDTTLYCGVPKNLPPNSGLQPALADGIADNLYRVDLNTGRSDLIAIPDNDVTMTNLTVTSDESRLFYQNEETGQIEVINLK